MKLIKRRSFIKFLGYSALASFVPKLYAETLDSDSNVQFFKKGSSLFNTYRKVFNKRIEISPLVIAVCFNEQGVKTAIKYANTNDLKLSIKSGGHSFEGFSLIHDGLVIDVSNMNDLQLNDDDQLIAEPGVKLAQLYGYCLPKGRLLPSGSCGGVGLSGITLGGGYGLFSRQFGLTCDYLTGVRMIDIEGNVLDSDSLPELLWACRGGGNGNFGVITQLRFSTVAAPETLYQHRFRSYELTPKTAAELAEFWFAQCATLPNHAYSAFVLNGRTLTVMLTSTEHDQAMAKILASFDSKMDQNANLNPDPIDIGVQYYYGRSDSLYFKNISAGYYEGFDDIKDCVEELFTTVNNTPGMLFQINTLGGEINNSSQIEKGAYAHRDVNYLGEAQCYWNDAEAEALSMARMKDIQTTLTQNGIEKHYVNYPDLNIQNYEQAYYGPSYMRLKKLKGLLDPNDRFTYSQGIKP